MATKTCRRPCRAQKPERLFPEMKVSDMTAIDRKIYDLLKAEGYTVINTERIARSGFQKDLNVNQFEYLRGGRERVYVTTHEPIRGGGQ